MKRRGSITVFSALSIMLVAQLLFAFLEAARHREFEKVFQMNTDTVLESVFADYCSPLWETYRLLGVTAVDPDGNFSLRSKEAQLRSLTGDNLGSKGSIALFSGVSLLTAEMTDAAFTDYLLMTDYGGKVYEQEVSAYMKENLVYETAKTVYNNYEAVKELKGSYSGSDESVKNAQDAVASAKEEANKTQPRMKKGSGRSIAEPAEAGTETVEEVENPLTAVTEAKRGGILSLVLSDQAKLSQEALSLENTVSHRKLNVGTKTLPADGDWYQKVLVNQYMVNYLSCYTAEGQGRALNYELEYLIGGKAKDADNLRLVAIELLGIREVLNMAALMAMPEKQADALALATAMVGVTLNPVLIEVVKYGILAAWAFAESVLDVRALLEGGKIALIKNAADWTSNVHNLPALLSGWSVSKSSSYGSSYSQYLSILLFFHNEDQIAMRAMDVQEATVRSRAGYENFQMDQVVCEADVCATYEYAPVFLGFVSLIEETWGCFRLQETGEYSYLRGKEGA